MSQRIAHIALLVNDYDEAIEFYTRKLNFELVEDTQLSDVKRWVLVRPKGGECCILLARAADEEQQKFVGNQSGGRVFLFLHTTDFDADYNNLIACNVTIVRETAAQPYGRVCVFADLYGNKWDLVEQK
jgi:catechol 2,3-dioxygenase-like lactoylglutathione lyase family enzyme